MSPPRKPILSQAQAPLHASVNAFNERGEPVTVAMPQERPLTIYLNREALVTLMTLGANPELLALGYLRNQALVAQCNDVRSVTVDWSVDACAIDTFDGQPSKNVDRSEPHVITTGCGQGTVYRRLLDDVLATRVKSTTVTVAQIESVLEQVRAYDSLYKQAGSVHGCALFDLGAAQPILRLYTEDVGRHNALDALAGWMWLNDRQGENTMLYTTGRLTSEMVMKAAQMGVAIVASRSGATQMGLDLAQRTGVMLLTRCLNRRFVVLHGNDRVVRSPPASARPKLDLLRSA